MRFAIKRFDGVAPEPRKGIKSGHIDGSKCIPYSEVKYCTIIIGLFDQSVEILFDLALFCRYWMVLKCYSLRVILPRDLNQKVTTIQL